MRQRRGRVEYRFRMGDGRYRWVADHFTVQTDADGTPTYRTGIIRDVTEQKAAALAMAEARESAERASLAKSQFLAVMSHELRTPLNGVIGFAALLENEVLGPLVPAQRDAIARIQGSAWHLVGIIDEILTFTRAEAGKEEVRQDEVDVAGVAREVVAMLQGQARAQATTLRLRGSRRLVALTDGGKVRQILTNLVGNALKYTDAGHVGVEVAVEDDFAAVRVQDTGPGIPLDHLDAIFEPFFQLDSSRTRTRGGTGLGLTICRRLAHLLGGDVTVSSTPGEGSTFTLRIPLGGRGGAGGA
jgi:signal transduction histidine kinase